MNVTGYQRSRHCGAPPGECIEAAITGQGHDQRILVRDSHETNGKIVLQLTPDEWGKIVHESALGHVMFTARSAQVVGFSKNDSHGHPADTLFEMSDGKERLYFTADEIRLFGDEAAEPDSHWLIENLHPAQDGPEGTHAGHNHG